MEEWKTLTNYYNYEISNLGKVRNKNTKRILKPYCKDGDLYISLSLNGKIHTFKVHQLVFWLMF